MVARKPKKPKFPRRPKSSNLDALERWVKKVETVSADYKRKLAEFKKVDDRRLAVLKRAEKARSL